MKKTIMSILTVWILVSAGLFGIFIINSEEQMEVSAKTIIVDDNGTPGVDCNYTHIQWAIDNATDGDTVFVKNGTYYENVIVNKTINLTGEDRDNTIIDGGGSGDVVLITSDWVNITRFTVRNSGSTALFIYDAGIDLDNVQNCSLENNELSNNNMYGLYIHNFSKNNIITNNVCSYNVYGIVVSYANNNAIAANSASNNQHNGIYLRNSNKNIVTNNTVSNHGDSSGILLHSSDNNNISHNLASKNYVGISFSSSGKNTIINNTAVSNYYIGIAIYSSSKNNNITYNTASLSTYYGVYLFNSANNNTLTNNTISSNGWYGIYFWSSVDFNVIKCNIVLSNGIYGIYLEDSSNNRIYHNNIINNSNQAYDDTNNDNQWDNGYPIGGNYWSDFDEPNECAYDDYKGLDQNVLGRDNIVDNGTLGGGGKNPYIIDSDSQDNYPLISPIGNLTFLNEGWNLISIPFIQPDTDLGKVLESIKGSFDTVEWYNASDDSDYWKINNTNKLDIQNDLDNIDHIKGFWIHITEPRGVLFEHSGAQPIENQTITLQPGWNMVGYPSIKNYNRTAGLNNLTFGTHIDSIWTYNAAIQRWDEIGPSDYFDPGKGYWIHSKTKCVWEVPI